MSRERWCWWGDGGRECGFRSREDAVESAVAVFGLSEEQRIALLADGWIPLGSFSSIKVCDEDDCSI